MKHRNFFLTILFWGSILSLASCSSVSPEQRSTEIERVAAVSERSRENESRTMNEDFQAEWAREVPRKMVSTPYSFCENLVWIKNNLFGPSSKYKELTQFIPESTILNEISPKLKLGFFGDIMQMKGRKLEFGDDLKHFFADVDYLIGNFEGVISSSKGGLMASVQSEAILIALKSLFAPEKTVLTNANNHTCDFGWKEFNKSYQLQKDHGFLAVGRKDEPAILLDTRVNLANVTKWSNQPCTHIADFNDIDAAFNSDAVFNILSPHWGYEMQLYPNPDQIQKGKDLLEKWDMIVGHHSHCPQVITYYEGNNSKKLLAYSLGDFSTHLKIEKYLYGIVVKAEVGPNSEGEWQVGRVEWRFSTVNHVDEATTKIGLAEECEFFDLSE